LLFFILSSYLTAVKSAAVQDSFALPPDVATHIQQVFVAARQMTGDGNAGQEMTGERLKHIIAIAR
jgi:hypothetical protein